LSDRQEGLGRALPPLRKLLLAMLLLAAGSEFIVRGPVRFLRQSSDWNDLVPVYVPSRAWLLGANPYSPNVYADLWTRTFGKPWSPAAARSYAVYPLSTFVLLSPLAALPWPVAQKVAAALGVLLVGAMIVCLVRFANLTNEAACLFAAATLALAPIHTGLATGNISVAVIALACIAASVAEAERTVLAGILLAAVVGLKPQVGLCFLLYYLLRRRWLICGLATAGVGLTLLTGAFRMRELGISWTADFARNARVFVGSNPVDDFTLANPVRFTLIDLQVPFYDLTGARTSAIVLAFGVVVLLALVWLLLFLRTRSPDDLLNVSILATLSLLPIYHRFYDASLLVLPICWTIRAAAPEYSRLRIACGLLFLPFLFPGATALAGAASAGHIPEVLLRSWCWQHLVMPHEIWALLLLVIVLLAAMAAHPPQLASPTVTPSRPKETPDPATHRYAFSS
jgi:hypothetical protein